MSDPRFRSAPAHLRPGDEIGDALLSIRRLIAEDDALSAARDRLQTVRNQIQHEDAADFLARRYGGNAALARQLAAVDSPADVSGAAETALPDIWPLGAFANAPDAPRPLSDAAATPRNDLPRRLGSLFDEMDDDDVPLTRVQVTDAFASDAARPLILPQHDFETVLDQPAAAGAELPASDDLPATQATAPAQPAEDESEAAILDLLRDMVHEQMSEALVTMLPERLRADILPQLQDELLDQANDNLARLIEAALPERLGREIAAMQATLRTELETGLGSALSSAVQGEFEMAVPARLNAELKHLGQTLRDDLLAALHQEMQSDLTAAIGPCVRSEVQGAEAALQAQMLGTVPAAVQAEFDACFRDRLHIELQSGLRDTVLGELRETVQTEIETDLPERIRAELPAGLSSLLRGEMQGDLHDAMQGEVQAQLQVAMDSNVQDHIQARIREEMRGELADVIREQLRGSLRDAVEDGIQAELRDMIRAELLGELGERFSRNLRLVIRREVATAVDAQVDRL